MDTDNLQRFNQHFNRRTIVEDLTLGHQLYRVSRESEEVSAVETLMVIGLAYAEKEAGDQYLPGIEVTLMSCTTGITEVYVTGIEDTIINGNIYLDLIDYITSIEDGKS